MYTRLVHMRDKSRFNSLNCCCYRSCLRPLFFFFLQPIYCVQVSSYLDTEMIFFLSAHSTQWYIFVSISLAASLLLVTPSPSSTTVKCKLHRKKISEHKWLVPQDSLLSTVTRLLSLVSLSLCFLFAFQRGRKNEANTLTQLTIDKETRERLEKGEKKKKKRKEKWDRKSRRSKSCQGQLKRKKMWSKEKREKEKRKSRSSVKEGQEEDERENEAREKRWTRPRRRKMNNVALVKDRFVWSGLAIFFFFFFYSSWTVNCIICFLVRCVIWQYTWDTMCMWSFALYVIVLLRSIHSCSGHFSHYNCTRETLEEKKKGGDEKNSRESRTLSFQLCSTCNLWQLKWLRWTQLPHRMHSEQK